MSGSPAWPVVRLKEITTKIGSGATPRGGKGSYKSEGISLIRSLNVYDFVFSYDDLAFIDYEQAQQLANVEVRAEDILLNITGASVARCCMVPSDILPARVNQHVSIVRLNLQCAVPHYVLYCLNSPQYKNHLLALAQGGATREALTKSTIENFQVPLPPLPIQRRIAAVLSAYDDLIEVNQQRIEALEAAAQALYREWFVEFRFPGYESAEWVESELGEIPAGWEVCRLGDIAQQVRRNVQPNEVKPETPYVGLAHIPSRTLALRNWGQAQETTSSKLIFREGEILFAKIRPYLHKVVVAPLDGVCSSDTIVIAPIHPALHGFVTMLSSSKEFVDYADATSKGTSMPRADWDAMAEYPIVLPPDRLLIRFNSFVDDVISHIRTSIFRNRVLRETRDLLLPRLISGEVSVEGLLLPGEDPL